MIHLFTDFGTGGPYQGQMTARLRQLAPEVPVIDLLSTAPMRDPRRAAYLLAAILRQVPSGDIVLAVVDPGVGGDRLPLALSVDGRWLVGPDNGLFEPALRQAVRWAGRHIAWRPQLLSASFHGRDLFAPVAADLARGRLDKLGDGGPTRFPDWPDDLPAVIFIDHYGNAMTGLRATAVAAASGLLANGRLFVPARTFSDVPPGAGFWYANSQGLVELAVNGGSAARDFGLVEGSPVEPRS